MEEIQRLLDAGYTVEFEKDDADYLAHVSEGHGLPLHSGIADTPDGALDAAVEGLRAFGTVTATMGGDR